MWKRWLPIAGVKQLAELMHDWEEQGIFFVNTRARVLPAPPFLRHIGDFMLRFFDEVGCCMYCCRVGSAAACTA